MAKGVTSSLSETSFVTSDEVERLKASLRRWHSVRALFFRALVGVVTIWIWLVTAEAARRFIPSVWWEKIIAAPVNAGISKL